MPDLGSRIVIIGNSGAGKSVLAASLGTRLNLPVTDLDQIHWIAPDVKRVENEAIQAVRAEASNSVWIVEGVYGWLAEVALPRATGLIWVDVPWSVCEAGLLARGTLEPHRNHSELMRWASEYWTRQTSSSYAGHLALFENFPGTKIRVTERDNCVIKSDAFAR